MQEIDVRLPLHVLPLPPAIGAAVAVNDGKSRSPFKPVKPSVAHAWKIGLARQVPTASPRPPATPEASPVEPSVPSDAAIQADAMPEPAATAEAPGARMSDAFGLDPDLLKDDLVAGTKRFLRHYDRAEKREHRAKYGKHYEAVSTPFVRDDGSIDKEDRWSRTRKTRAQRIQARNRQDGERVKRGYNHLSHWLHAKAGRPRKTGSNYGSKKGSGSLLAPATLVPSDLSSGAASLGKWGASATRAGLANEHPEAVPNASFVGDGFSDLGLFSTIVDAADGVDGALTMVNRDTDDKANLLRCREDALRFRRNLEEATPEEALAYLQFDNSAARLLDPTLEEQATDAVTKAYAIKSSGLNPVSSGVSVGAQVAGYVGHASAAVGLVSGPLGVAAGAADMWQATGEYARRQAQIETASERKKVIEEVAADLSDGPGAAVRRGVLASLWTQQDRLERQGRYEVGFSIVRGVKSFFGMVAGTTGTVVAGVTLAGVATAAVATPAAVVLAAPAAFGGGFIAGRSWIRHRAEHRSKWRERAADAAIRSMSRQQLEEMLSRPPGMPAELTVSLGRGEYLAGEDRFAGEKTITFDVRENEYVGLHVFALQIQDLIRTRDAKAAAPWIATLRRLGVDSVRLLAICKATSARPAHQQLDFIKTYLAPALGMKHRMAGSKAVPHPSVFLGRFQNALLDAGIGKKVPPSPSAYRRVRDELVKQFGDGEAGMDAFKASTSDFLSKTKKLPPSSLRTHLQAFLSVEG